MTAAAATTAMGWLADRWAPGGRERWARINYRGRSVDLLGGPVAAAGAVAAAGTAGAAPLLVATAAAGLGLYDDLAGATHARGLRGHLRALRHGQVTTGLVKMIGLAAAGVAAGALNARDRAAAGLPGLDIALDAALVSGTANLVNLLDLRPGRALKVVAAVGLPLATRRGAARSAAAGAAAAGVVATALAALPADLGERRMVGDCGANTLGAVLGWSMSAHAGRPGRATALGTVIGLTLLSEFVSFSAVIERTPWLAAADRWGRLPA